MSKQETNDDYPYGLVKGKVPPGFRGTTRWDNMLQDDIFEIIIGPFKTQEEMQAYVNKLSVDK